MPVRVLIGISLLVGVGVAVLCWKLDTNTLSAVGSIIAAGGSLLAVLWFSASLRYQANQLEEQRKQFSAQFMHL